MRFRSARTIPSRHKEKAPEVPGLILISPPSRQRTGEHIKWRDRMMLVFDDPAAFSVQSPTQTIKRLDLAGAFSTYLHAELLAHTAPPCERRSAR